MSAYNLYGDELKFRNTSRPVGGTNAEPCNVFCDVFEGDLVALPVRGTYKTDFKECYAVGVVVGLRRYDFKVVVRGLSWGEVFRVRYDGSFYGGRHVQRVFPISSDMIMSNQRLYDVVEAITGLHEAENEMRDIVGRREDISAQLFSEEQADEHILSSQNKGRMGV